MANVTLLIDSTSYRICITKVETFFPQMRVITIMGDTFVSAETLHDCSMSTTICSGFYHIVNI